MKSQSPPYLLQQTQGHSPREIEILAPGCIEPHAALVRAAGDEWKDPLAGQLGVVLENNFDSSPGGEGWSSDRLRRT